jgi:hypothetical protein
MGKVPHAYDSSIEEAAAMMRASRRALDDRQRDYHDIKRR